MNSTHVFSSKAEKYDRYRWSYAPEAIQAIFNTTGITAASTVADIGAGTGIMTREFVGKVGKIFAIEPNPEMRSLAAKNLGGFPSCQIVDGQAEATTLPNQSIDLIIAAQAVHWFDPPAARKEFRRIIRTEGWLALCRNFGDDPELGKVLSEIYPPQTDTENQMIGNSQPKDFYFSEGRYQKLAFPFSRRVNWEEFFGGLASASFAPEEGSSLYTSFESNARKVFKRFSTKNRIEIRGVTELYLGQIHE